MAGLEGRSIRVVSGSLEGLCAGIANGQGTEEAGIPPTLQIWTADLLSDFCFMSPQEKLFF